MLQPNPAAPDPIGCKTRNPTSLPAAHFSPCQVLDRVGEAQAAAGSGAPGRVTFEGCSSSGSEPLPDLDMYRPVSGLVNHMLLNLLDMQHLVPSCG